MAIQMRRYTVDPSGMDDLVRLWREHIVPLRTEAGFTVIAGWANAERNEFVWFVERDGGEEEFEAAAAAYYALPEREKRIPTDQVTKIVLNAAISMVTRIDM